MSGPGMMPEKPGGVFGYVRSLESPVRTAILYGLGSLISFSLALALSTHVIHISPDITMIGSLWALITFIVVAQDSCSSTRDAARFQVLGSLIGAIVSAIFLAIFPFSIIGMACAIGITVLACELLRFPGTARFAALTAGIIMVVSAINPAVPPFINAGTRFLEVIIGCVVAVVLVRVWQYLPGRTRTPG